MSPDRGGCVTICPRPVRTRPRKRASLSGHAQEPAATSGTTGSRGRTTLEPQRGRGRRLLRRGSAEAAGRAAQPRTRRARRRPAGSPSPSPRPGRRDRRRPFGRHARRLPRARETAAPGAPRPPSRRLRRPPHERVALVMPSARTCTCPTTTDVYALRAAHDLPCWYRSLTSSHRRRTTSKKRTAGGSSGSRESGACDLDGARGA